MLPDSWPRCLTRVVFVGVDFPTISGGSRYIETFGEVLAGPASPSTSSPSTRARPSPPLPYQATYPEKELFKFPVSRGLTGVRKLRSLPRYVRKHTVRATRARAAARWLQHSGTGTVIVFTHVLALAELVRLGFDPRRSRALLVGQHHSSYSTVDIDAGVGAAMEQHFPLLHGMTALSDADAALFERRLHISVRATHNPSSVAATAVETMPWGERPARLIALARFSPEKRLPLLVAPATEALADPRVAQWRLDIYGEDSGAAELRRAVAASNAADRITVYPATDSPLAELASSRINLLASEHERFGLSLLEAGCLGVPSVAFDVSPGVHDLMTTLGGALIPEGNHRAYIQAVVDLMTREDHGAQAGRRSRRGSLAYAPAAVLEEWGRALQEFARRQHPSD